MHYVYVEQPLLCHPCQSLMLKYTVCNLLDRSPLYSVVNLGDRFTQRFCLRNEISLPTSALMNETVCVRIDRRLFFIRQFYLLYFNQQLTTTQNILYKKIRSN